MTRPAAELKANAEKALRLMWEHVGDRHFDAVWFDPAGKEWGFVLPTTWVRLVSDGRLRDDAGEYQLTYFGWGMAEERFAERGHLLRRCQSLRRALSDVVTAEGRTNNMLVDAEELASMSGLPEGWVSNVLTSFIFQNAFPDDECAVHKQDRSQDFMVPSNFGHPKFDI